MTKNQEIEILIEAANKLGPDSYAGTWLAEQIPFIQMDIRSDHPVGTAAVSISEAKEMVIKAREDARKIEADTKKYCEELIETWRKQAWKIREDILNRASNSLKEYAAKLDKGML